MVIKCQDPRSVIKQLKREQGINFDLRKNVERLKSLLSNKSVENKHLRRLLKQEIKRNQELLKELNGLKAGK